MELSDAVASGGEQDRGHAELDLRAVCNLGLRVLPVMSKKYRDEQ